MATEFVTVAAVDDITPNLGKMVVVDGREIALFLVDGTFYAMDNTCPHSGAPLAEGWVDGAEVTCPWHAWSFRMADGKMTLGDYSSVDVFDVRVIDGQVQVARTPRDVAN